MPKKPTHRGAGGRHPGITELTKRQGLPTRNRPESGQGIGRKVSQDYLPGLLNTLDTIGGKVAETVSYKMKILRPGVLAVWYVNEDNVRGQLIDSVSGAFDAMRGHEKYPATANAAMRSRIMRTSIDTHKRVPGILRLQAELQELEAPPGTLREEAQFARAQAEPSCNTSKVLGAATRMLLMEVETVCPLNVFRHAANEHSALLGGIVLGLDPVAVFQVEAFQEIQVDVD